MRTTSTTRPVFSVIIPAYMADQYLAEAIQSVLDQTFPNFEIIVVNDASPDKTTAVMEGFSDSRINYIIHLKNQGLPATRNTAIRASRGKYIAMLDADDVFHPDKLQAHYDFLAENPDVDVTYNSRFEVFGTTENIRRLWIAPDQVVLTDFVVGYPFAPSDIVVRRDRLFNIGLLHENNNLYGEDLNTNCRLALAGCKFGYVRRVLNYRRHHPSRTRKNLEQSLMDVFRNLNLIFNDPRCPREVVKLRDKAYAYNYSVWAYWALAQEETELGIEFLRKTLKHNPAIMKDGGPSLLYFLIWSCVTDERGDLLEAMGRIFKQLPDDFATLRAKYKWALGRAYLIRGFEDVMWGRFEKEGNQFERAMQHQAVIDAEYVGLIVHQLAGYEIEYGKDAVVTLVEKLKPYLNMVSKQSGNELEASYLINSAFRSYRSGNYKDVPRNVFRAWMRDPSYLTNRGVISIFIRSMVQAAL